MDLLIFRMINGLAGRWPLLDLAMVALAEAIVPISAVLLLLFWLLPGPGRHRRRISAVLAFLAAILALGLTDIPGYFYSRPRPFEIYRVTQLLHPPLTPSFPSTHVAMSAALATFLGPDLGAWRYAAWALVAVGMFGRVYAGVHYPADTLGGLVAGWLTGVLILANRDALRPFAERIVAGGEELL